MWVFVCFILNGVLISQTYGDPVLVKSSVGNIEGFSDSVYVDGQTKNLTKFLGIPYAESPTGDRRFMLPVPKARFNSTYRAMSYPPSCFQTRNDSVILSANYSEDCLFLNVFVPGNFDAVTSLPVMVWIHGGAFISGTSKTYQADVLSTFGNVIVVTVNYRLGALGFLRSSDGRLVGNQGLWDQHLAFKWVQDNIRDFHGNPDEVTIFGESAGSISVSVHALYAGNKGLFKRVIGQSGSAFGGFVSFQPNANEVINETSCSGVVDPIACLKTLSAKDLIQIETSFGPVVDGQYLVRVPEVIITGKDPISLAAKAMYSSVDLLTGVNSLDGGYQYVFVLAPALGVSDSNTLTINRSIFLNNVIPGTIGYLKPQPNNKTKVALEKYFAFEYTDWTDPDNSTKLRDGVVNMLSDSTFFQSMVTSVTSHCETTSRKTYMYEFGVVPSYHAITTPSWMKGSNHADDLLYVFGQPLSTIPLVASGDNFTPEEKSVSRAMMTMWTNFAKTSNPNMPEDITKYLGTMWTEYDMTSQSYLKITNQLNNSPIKHRFYPKRMELWRHIVPEILKQY